ncbi:GNAT family N-acetyltransferase [Methylocapsa aurea]|uniref:GNAT family N-acetyltransferase n=1 Tax=Methylocapsa aurea TaxID=663610 RepID=UPI00056BCAD6|nr:GNAT family N-acetyltransferase [Methylocapsa aurea]
MSDAPIRIRPLEALDRAGWEPLWKGYQTFYEVALPVSSIDLTFARLLEPAEPMHCVVATDGDAIVGIAQFLFHRSTWTPGDYCYLQDLFVLETRRGNGVGRALIEAVVARAKAQGASRVYWLTHETNKQAMWLYDQVAEKSGFLQYRFVL